MSAPSGAIFGAGEILVTARSDLRGLNKAEAEVKAFQQRIATAGQTPQLNEGLRQASQDVDKFRDKLGLASVDIQGLGTKSENPLKRISDGIGNVDKRLQDVGLSFRGVSILFGAGLAGGVIGVVRILEKFGEVLAADVAKERELLNQSKLTFGGASEDVIQFGENAESSLSLSREEALSSLNAFGLLAREMRFTNDESASLSEGFLRFAAVVRSTEPGFKTIEDVSKVIEQAIKGDDEALARLGVSADDFRNKSEQLFGRLPDQISDSERAVVLYAVGLDEAKKKTSELTDRSSPLVRLLRELKDASVSFASAFVDGLNRDIDIVDKLFKAIEDGYNRDKGILEKIVDALTPHTGELPPDKIRQSVRKLTDEQLRNTEAAIKSHIVETQYDRERIAAIDAEIERRKKAQEATDGQRKSVGDLARAAQEQTEKDFLNDSSKVAEAKQAFLDLQRAEVDGARNVARAEEDKQRVIEDNARKDRDLRIRTQREEADAAKEVADANRAVLDAAEQNRRDLQDAQNRVDDARLEAFRRNRKAQEDLEDFDRESSRRIIDLKQRVIDAHNREAEAIESAEIAIGNAILHRSGLEFNAAEIQLHRAKTSNETATAERDLQRELVDDAIKRSRLERDITETRQDGIKAIARAVEDQKRAEYDAIRRSQKAQEDLNTAVEKQRRATEDATNAAKDLALEEKRALEDADKRIQDAERERDRAIQDATTRLVDLGNSIGIVVDRLAQLLGLLPPTSEIFSGLTGPAGLMAGGRFTAGEPFFAGEGGLKELIIPDSNGTVISNEQLRRWFNMPSPEKSPQHVEYHVHEAVTPEATLFKLMNQAVQGIG